MSKLKTVKLPTPKEGYKYVEVEINSKHDPLSREYILNWYAQVFKTKFQSRKVYGPEDALNISTSTRNNIMNTIVYGTMAKGRFAQLKRAFSLFWYHFKGVF